ncbi:MAG: acyltransferase [Fibrobacteria bacterium]|nr:acyltransferase [Fibrobacteria bacterium]
MAGLDTLRFFAALWVVMRHGAMPPLTTGAAKGLPQTIDLIWRGSISGPAAVIVFFVISGLCIHHPYAQGKPFDLGEYLLRRFVRLTLPMVAALAIWRAYHGMDDFRQDWLAGIPAWSIVAEMIYYALYPLLRTLPGRPWKTLIGAGFAAAFALAWFTQKRSNIDYPAWGYHLDWVLGLPVWLLGVKLAEWTRALPDPGKGRILTARAIAVAAGSATTWLAWQRIAGHHLTLNLFALYAAWWIWQELGWFRTHPTSRLFERAGAGSYSLYLIHPLGLALWKTWGPPFFGHVADWSLKLGFVLGLSWVFHVLIEFPSHRLARHLGRRWTDRLRATRVPSDPGGPVLMPGETPVHRAG